MLLKRVFALICTNSVYSKIKRSIAYNRIKSNPLSTDTLQITKISLENYDNKRLRSFNGIATFPYGTNAFKVCLEELKIKQTFATYLNNQKLLIT